MSEIFHPCLIYEGGLVFRRYGGFMLNKHTRQDPVKHAEQQADPDGKQRNPPYFQTM